MRLPRVRLPRCPCFPRGSGTRELGVLDDGIQLGEAGPRPGPVTRSREGPRQLPRRFRTVFRSAAYSEVVAEEGGEKEGRAGSLDLDADASVRVRRYEHLVVMVHGLFGAQGNWKVISRRLRARLRGRGVLLYASNANRYSRTLAGIDTCARRVEEEIRQLLARHPGLKRISLLGHSMGGLVNRYMAGVNFDPVEGTLFGLEACHFVSIATPHLGCHSEGEAQLPLLGWAKAVPFLGSVFNKASKAYSSKIAGALYKSTGRQLFLADGSGGAKPLVARMVEDVPGEGYFFSSLAAFKTRTLYANSWGDAMVGWANASIRKTDELPRRQMKSHNGKGVFKQDDLRTASWGPRRAGLATDGQPGDVDTGDRQLLNEYMLGRLTSLPWCRVDVTFKGVYVPFMAHTHIQVTRQWIDSVGLSVAEHIAATVCKLEDMPEGRSWAAGEAEGLGGEAAVHPAPSVEADEKVVRVEGQSPGQDTGPSVEPDEKVVLLEGQKPGKEVEASVEAPVEGIEAS